MVKSTSTSLNMSRGQSPYGEGRGSLFGEVAGGGLEMGDLEFVTADG